MSSQPADILIVEDSRTQAELLRHLLEGGGHRVTIAADGAAALAAAVAHKPALILSDVEMPGMTGYEMCRRFKEDPHLKNIPIILLTCLIDPGDVLLGIEAGADYYLTKPYDSDHLLSQVQTVLLGPAYETDSATATTIEVVQHGKRQAVTATPRQMMNLLLSTYGNAVQRNKELIEAQHQVQERNKLLQEAVRAERAAHQKLKETQVQLIQTEKLASLGQMVAGIAHEINNPLSFVINNMAVLQRDLGAIREVLGLYQEAETLLARQPELHARIRESRDRCDLEYTLPNLREMLVRSDDGLRRIEQIVKGLRNFARLDESDLSDADVNAGIESTVNIVRAKAQDRQVQINLELGTLPLVRCYPGQVNQVVMNLLTNAIDACDAGGKVVVRTRAGDVAIHIDVIDDGCGIDPSIRDKIFDPFFTTKPPGHGTGLGLSISYGIVHSQGGSIDVAPSPPRGTRFTVTLPIQPAKTGN